MAKNTSKKFLEDQEYRLYRIKHLGKKHNWQMLLEADGVIIFCNKDITLTINPKTLSVETELTHPKKGETKLLRKGEFTMKLIEKAFQNPRAHMPNTITSNYIQR